VIEALFWIAVACGVAGALTGNRTAWALLASVAMCLALDSARIEFNFVVWMLIDLAVIFVIVRPGMTYSDVVILALFIPAWAFYVMPDPARFWGSFAVVVAQLLLCAPVASVSARARRWWADARDTDHTDLRMAHA
jgi:hypothetical protein